jgi:hypothetical protein
LKPEGEGLYPTSQRLRLTLFINLVPILSFQIRPPERSVTGRTIEVGYRMQSGPDRVVSCRVVLRRDVMRCDVSLQFVQGHESYSVFVFESVIDVVGGGGGGR